MIRNRLVKWKSQSRMRQLLSAKCNNLFVHFDFKFFFSYRFWILAVTDPSQSTSSRIESCSPVNRLRIVLFHWLDSVRDSANVFSCANSTVNGCLKLKRPLRNAYFWIINLFLSTYIYSIFSFGNCKFHQQPDSFT